MIRYEDKMTIDASVARRIADELARAMRPDRHGDGGRYRVATLYFDTFRLAAYTDAVEGTAARAKLRLRRYGDEPARVLELKHKRGRVRAKTRLAIDRAGAERLLDAPFAALTPETSPFAAFAARSPRRAVTAVTYERAAWVARMDPTFRVTIDSNVRAGGPALFDRAPRSTDRRVLSPAQAILEVKHRGRWPAWFRALVRRYELSASRVSKYRLAIERAVLPARRGAWSGAESFHG